MKFLIDAHLPPSLCRVFTAANHDAVHVSSLASGNKTKDGAINHLSIQENRVVVSKDSDFYYSHLLKGEPSKLLLVRTGNLRLRDLVTLFERHLPEIISALEKNSLVELDRVQVTVRK